MKLILGFVGVIGAFVLIGSFSPVVIAQTADPVIAQITSSATGNSFTGGISRNGRFVVIESTGDIATEKTPNTRDTAGNILARGRNNEDGNREIFLFDYAQRRIFQITVTESLLKTQTVTPTPTPSATPVPVPSPTPVPVTSLQIEISNNKPVISSDGKWIAFSSNALNPASFNANESANQAALGTTDTNQEIFIYRVPDAPEADLSSGLEVPRVNLEAGTFTRITNTLASRPPQPGNSSTETGNVSPFVAFDNVEVDVSEDGSFIAFVSTRNLTVTNGLANADENPEIYVYNRASNSISQLTDTQGRQVFNGNPSLSANGSAIAFLSNANIPDSNGASNNSDGNGEVYLAGFNGTARTTLRQVTNTAQVVGLSVNIFSPGRRISPGGDFVAFESYADLAGGGTLQASPGLYLYDVARNSFALVSPRAGANDVGVLRFPTFSGDNTTLVFTSSLNFNADGTAPASATDGLNPGRNAQIFSTPISSPTTFTRLTTTPAIATGGIPSDIQPMVSNTVQRITFGTRVELGGGNPDGGTEAHYLFRPNVVSETPASANAVSYSTGASRREVVAPSATPTPPAVAGLAAGMLTVAQSTAVQLAPSIRAAGAGSELRRPHLPIELNGVTVSINGAAAGLYFVGSNEISFVVPIGLAATTGTQTYPVVINNNGAAIRSTVQISTTQPDIFTSANGAGGRAAVLNVTDPLSLGTPEPFTVTTTYIGADGQAKTEATLLRLSLTGIRNINRTQITAVRIGETSLTGDAIVSVTPTQTPGFDQVDVRLPASLAAAGDVPIIVTISGASSRPAESAPRLQIN